VLLSARWLDTPRLWVDRRFDNGRLAEEERKRTDHEPRRERGSARYRNVAKTFFALQLAFVALLFWLGQALIPLVSFGCVVALLAFLSAVLAARGESIRTEPPGAAPLLGLSAAFATGALAVSVTSRVTNTHIPQEWGLLGAMVLLPAVIDLLSRMSHFRLTGQPGYDFALRQTEGDFEKRPEFDKRFGTLIDAIFQTVPEEKRRFEKITPFRPDKETVYVDLVPGDDAPPN